MTTLKSSVETVESQIYHPLMHWLVIFNVLPLAFGITGMLFAERLANWIGWPDLGWVIFGFFALHFLVTAIGLCWGLWRIVSPPTISHTLTSQFAGVSVEPVTVEGAVAHQRLTHELQPREFDWQYRPRQSLRAHDACTGFVSGIVFSVIFAGVLTWVFHEQLGWKPWMLAAVYAGGFTILALGSIVILTWLSLRASYAKLCRLTIRATQDDVELDWPVEAAQLSRVGIFLSPFSANVDWQQVAIPRERLVAVQLCPWKFISGPKESQTIQFVVQGLLVWTGEEEGDYRRLPILLTSDYVGAARLLARLAEILRVPFLFYGDRSGWRQEIQRAKLRVPLQSGGTMI